MKSLIAWRRGVGALEQLRQEMDDLAQRFFGEPLGGNGPATVQAWAPRVDIEETDKEILVKADLPGVEPKDVEITVTDGSLVLRGERKEEREDKRKHYHRVERFVGQFYREVPLPPGTDPDKIVANGAKGVVTVSIPKKPEVQAKKIPVRSQG
jgi:HSP20 family protein